MSSLKLTFENVYDEVGVFLGIGTSPDTAELVKIKNITYRGYRNFLFPAGHLWSFLKQEATITTSAGAWVYELPADYGFLVRKFEFGADDSYPVLRSRSVAQIMSMRNMSDSNSCPKYYAERAGNYQPESGQRYEVILHSPPNGVYTFNYSYCIEPAKPVNDADYFVGGMLASECILESALAVAETQEDETIGIHSQLAAEAITKLVAWDIKHSPASVGFNYDTGLLRSVSWREWYIPEKLSTGVYGVE